MDGKIKSLRTLAAMHSIFFLAASIYLLIFTRDMGLIPYGFLLTGIVSLGAYYQIKKQKTLGPILALLSTIIYWIMSWMVYQTWGIIRGISITISLMGLLALLLIFNRNNE